MDSNPSSDDRMLEILEAYDRALAAGRSATTIDDRAVPDDLKPQVEGARVCLELLEAAFPRAQRPTLSPNGIDYIITGNRPLPLPERIGRYTILKELGRSQGIVYLADDPALGRQVAVKVLRAGELASPQEVSRFRREAEAVGRLKDPRIVEIYDIGDYKGEPFIVLEYMPGGNLSEFIAGKPQPPKLAAKLVETLARAMELVHSKDIVHRDLKPSNILLGGIVSRGSGVRGQESGGRGQESEVVVVATPIVKVADFGLAKKINADTTKTLPGTIMGTARYMAPEQAYGRVDETTPRTDVYGLGAILYELLTGSPPFRGDSLDAILAQVRLDDPVPPRQREPSVPRDLEKICLKCLYKAPKDRYESARALAEDLRGFLAGKSVRPKPEARVSRLVRVFQRHKTAAILLGCTALLAVAMVIWPQRPERPSGDLTHNWDAIRKELQAGQPVQLIDEKGKVLYRRVRAGKAPIPSNASFFRMSSYEIFMLDLVPDPQWEHYRVSVEMSIREDGDAQGGIYLSAIERPTPPPHLEQWLCAALSGGHHTQNREFKLFPIRYISEHAERPFHYQQSYPTISTLFAPASVETWRRFQIEVHGASIAAYWENNRVGESTIDQINNRQISEMIKEKPKFDGIPVALNPRGAIGLYVCKGAAWFRNVWLEPLNDPGMEK